TFTATVSAVAPATSTPTGMVTFKDGATPLGNVALTNGRAVFTTSSLTATSHSITAVYNGDQTFNSSTAAPLTINISATKTKTAIKALTTSLNPASAGTAVTFTVTVAVVAPASGLPMGSVLFKDGTALLANVNTTNGRAVFTTSKLSIGA